MIVKGDKVSIKPEWQDKGDDAFDWVAVDNEENGRVVITATNTGLTFAPVQVVKVEWLAA